MEAVGICAKQSMARAAEEVKGLPHYASEGEVRVCRVLNLLLDLRFKQWVITDAWHDSTSNAFHTTVPCLSGRWEISNYCIFSVLTVFTIIIVRSASLELPHSQERTTLSPRRENWSARRLCYLVSLRS